MTVANLITIIRILLIPGFMVAAEYGGIYGDTIALAIFIVASVTDGVDGYIARRYNQITTLGIFLDPLADKLLVCSALICLIPSGKLETWIVLVIIAREFIISGFRLVASDSGIVIAASYWGKFKTVSHMAMIILLIIDFQNPVLILITDIVVWIGVALTIISLVDYVAKNKQVITHGGL